jgi:hypothetical protein
MHSSSAVSLLCDVALECDVKQNGAPPLLLQPTHPTATTLGAAVGILAFHHYKGYTFREEKTLRLRRSGDPTCRTYFEAMRMRMISVGALHVDVS